MTVPQPLESDKSMNIAVLTSGGVDSSVALSLLEEKDHDVTAVYLKIWLERELRHLNQCPWQEDLEYIRHLCKLSGAKLRVIEMQKQYFEYVVQYAIDEVQAGRTPNPDIFCNNRIKFGAFYDMVHNDYDAIASGHYARIVEVESHKCLAQAPDPIKDQCYFLAQLPANRLHKLQFPIGNYTKDQVRALAQEFMLPNAQRKDSQGICFLGQFKYRDFIKHYLGTKKGQLVNADNGKIMGHHDGFWFYTPGQRKGIPLHGGPWFVMRTEPETNVVYISNTYHQKTRKHFFTDTGNWFLGELPAGRLRVKLRHGPKFHNCLVTPIDSGLEVILDASDQGIARGQYAVFYKENLCLGSAVINEN